MGKLVVKCDLVVSFGVVGRLVAVKVCRLDVHLVRRCRMIFFGALCKEKVFFCEIV